MSLQFTAELNYLQSFHVLGLVISALSDETTAVAHILGPVLKPTVSYGIIQSALNVKIKYPTLKDLWPLYDTFAVAVVSLLRDEKWDTFNVMFENTYPYDLAYTAMRYTLKAFELCQTRKVAVNWRKVYSGDQNLTAVVEEILNDPLSSRIIVVLGTYHLHFLLSIINRDVGGDGKLIWIGCKEWGTLAKRKLAPFGSFSFELDINEDPNLRTYLRGLNASSENPWFLEVMKEEFDCSTSPCIKEKLGQVIGSTKHLSGIIDAVNVFAHLLKDFLAKKCPGTTGTNAKTCYMRFENEFSKFINYVKFQGISSRIDFREHAFNVKKMLIYQTYDWGASTVGVFDFEDPHTLEIYGINLTGYAIPRERLDSKTYCRMGCTSQEYRHVLTRCCWDCRRCKNHEVVSVGALSCERCPTLYWPHAKDENSTMHCRRIKQNYFHWDATIAGVLMGLSLTGVLWVLVLFCQYWTRRRHFIIKASSVEISIAQLVVILLGYLSILLTLGRPTTLKCSLFILIFKLSFNIMYVTMLIKAIRVYRIFLNTRGRRRVTYTSPPVQIGFILTFIAFEIGKFLSINQVHPVISRDFQPDIYVEYVEKSCYTPIEHMIPFGIYDLILLFLSSLFAFKTHNLPNHFKESRFVSMCVLTTLIMWAVLMPSYIVTLRPQMKTFFLILAILINHTMALKFLFMTRLLAIYYVDQHSFPRVSIFSGTSHS